MKQELERKLVEAYPNLYRDYGGDPRETCMACGITCGDGWFVLIDELSAKLEAMDVVAAQVKEKFGGLRFYVQTCPEPYVQTVDELIEQAENQSWTICEICGKAGACRDMFTACDACRRLR